MSKTITLRLGTTWAMSDRQRQALDWALLQQVEMLGLELEGDFPDYTVSTTERRMDPAAQVALLDWLIDQPGVVSWSR